MQTLACAGGAAAACSNVTIGRLAAPIKQADATAIKCTTVFTSMPYFNSREHRCPSEHTGSSVETRNASGKCGLGPSRHLWIPRQVAPRWPLQCYKIAQNHEHLAEAVTVALRSKLYQLSVLPVCTRAIATVHTALAGCRSGSTNANTLVK